MRGASRRSSGTGLILAAAVLAVLSLSGTYLRGYLQQTPPSNGRLDDTLRAKHAAVGPTPLNSSNKSYQVRLGKAKARDAFGQAFRADLAARALRPGLSWVVSAAARSQGRADVELFRQRGPPTLNM
jgi:hypothetical protein